MRDTLPAFPPSGRDGGPQLEWHVAPKHNVFLIQPGETPVAEKVAEHAAACKAHGLEQVVHTMGEPLPDSLCDVVVVMVIGWFNTVTRGPLGRFALPGEVFRGDMVEFVKQAEDCLPVGSRILQPQLVVGSH